MTPVSVIRSNPEGPAPPEIPAAHIHRELDALRAEHRHLTLRVEHEPSDAADAALAWAEHNDVPVQRHAHPDVVIIPGTPILPKGAGLRPRRPAPAHRPRHLAPAVPTRIRPTRSRGHIRRQSVWRKQQYPT